ncbi:HTH domain protein [Clostridiales bacterium oral taxon 876 str. F0540]|nr:HTH domain protein [Clostridiales bacterium oral taxon 876 str. F0540]
MKTKELAEALGVSERMIRKYMSDLEEANINVQSVPGPTGGYELIGYDYILNLDIKKEEAVALELAAKQLKTTNFTLKEQLESLSNKVKITSERNNQLEDYSGNVVLKPKAVSLEKESKFELEIQAACISKNKLRIRYSSVSSGPTVRVVRPYGIITRNNLKYLIAYCEKKEKPITFKLMRVDQVEILEDKFHIPEDFSIRNFMRNHLGLFNEETYNIKLLISKPFSRSVSEGIYAEDQKVSWVDEDTILFEGQMSGRPDIIRWILSMRTSVKVIEPEILKNEIKDELKKMLETI